MGVEIRLLGPPQIVVDGAPRVLKGRKSWGLLATVLLEPHTTRRQLVDRLFADAEDPMATLRWHLLQVRRAVQPAGIRSHLAFWAGRFNWPTRRKTRSCCRRSSGRSVLSPG
ncbi:hypothetical protein BH23ACT12_BH23ACT12_23240 [soil metagenome]